MLKSFLKVLLFIFALIFNICGLGNLIIVCLGGSINLPSMRLSSFYGAIEISGIEEYPYCRWWENKDGWHYEHNPVICVNFPADNKCHVCGKQIEQIQV